MADTKITALAAITTVDPAADVLPIVDVSDTSMAASGTTKKITSNQILGAGGTATLASATITGDLTVRTNKLAVTSTGVGAGTASPGCAFEAYGSSTTEARISTITSGDVRLGMSLIGVSYNWIDSLRASGAMVFGVSNTERLRLDSSGNLGLGVTPSAWLASSYKAFQVNTTGVLASFGSGSNQSTRLANNWFSNASGVDTYITSNFATVYQQAAGVHSWYTAASGTAGNAITFTQAMTLDASGNLLVGTPTSPSGAKVGAITKLSGVSLEGTASISVSTTPVVLSRATGLSGLYFVQGYNTSGGSQGWWLVASSGGGTPTVIANGNSTGLTVTFTMVSGALNMNTSSGTVAVNVFSITQ